MIKFISHTIKTINMKVKEQISGILFIGITLLYIQSAMAQGPAVTRQVINGTIRDEGTGKPIRSVSVFFEGTLNGTATDSAGNFTLYPQTTVKLPILVSGVGYFSKTITDYALDKKLVIDLKERSIDLDAVVITANDGMSRAEKIKIFKREFLGSSPSAKSCEILNEDDLRFTYSSKTHILKATCDKPLIIHNKNLGYTLNFLLSSFMYNGQQTAFYGSPFFREDASPPDPDKVSKARKNIYLGSQIHFIRSLWNDEMAKNNFEVTRKFQLLTYDSLVVISGNQKYLRFNGQLKVAHQSQFSFMEGTGKPIAMDKNGYLDPSGIVWTGNIGMQRAGDLLPLEYNIKAAPGRESKEIKNSISTGVAMSVSLDTLRSRMLQEKLYIQLDKPYYSIGDTLRMKAYLLDAAQGKGSDKSGIVYVELANDSNKVLFRRMLPVGFGLGTGNIILKKDDIPEGSYTLRAYTNLMRNFGEETSFRKNLYISSGTSQNWLVNSKTKLSKQSGKDNLQLALQFNELNRKALGNRELEIRVMDGEKVLQRDKVQTDIDGKMNVNFNLPENVTARNLSMVAADPRSAAHKVTIPIAVNRPENIDLQFMPEGGNLVTGVPSRVGFKAIGEDGNAVEVSGKVYNSNNEEVASFASLYKGMGSFELKPLGTSAYTARVNGTTKSFPLPTVKSTGSVLRITNSAASDSVKATVTVSTNLVTTSLSYHLVGQSGGKVYYDEDIPVNGNTYITKGIAKDLFPTGVARFTLMNPDRQPLNERVAFIDHHDNLEITLQPAKASYKTRDSVSLAIEVKDSEGRPVEGSFSLAVTDDSQVHTDSLSANILTSMLLTSGLKGTVEEPGHYLQANAQAAIDLDQLLLTQGWIGYDWKEVFTPPAIPLYPAEPEFVVKGKVTNVSKSSQATAVVLMSSRPSFVKTAVADKDGSFTFSDFPVKDTLRFFVQAKNPKVRSLDIEPVEFKPEVFKPANRRYIPWYVNSDTTLLRQATTRALEEGKITAKGTNLLQEVTIEGKRIVKGSKNLNGPGESDQTLDEKDLAMGSKKTLLDVMEEKIKGFNTGVFPTKNPPLVGLMNSYGLGESGGKPGDLKADQGGGTTIYVPFEKKQSYRIYDKELHLVIDGTDVEEFYIPIGVTHNEYISLRNAAPYTERLEFIKSFLKYIKADDIKGVEVMHDPRYNAKYKGAFSSDILGNLSVAAADFAFVEVTTYSGNGAYMIQIPGVAIYRPLTFVNNAAFYKPKYTSKPSPLADLRSTIHWEPDIVTDKTGKAIVSFYSADRPGTYSIIMEGSNMNGSVGRKTGTINIK
ncbi:MAG TPA: hypothetical protein DIT07_00860 [Sphingobacteriaceae bacterium]|nr:hypothetical protein [Sphingobacteriaceae bacterium]